MAKPEDFEALHQAALVQGFEGDLEGSFFTLLLLLQEHPGHTGVRYDLAMLLMMRGRYEEACAQLREVLRLDPTHGPALRQSHFC